MIDSTGKQGVGEISGANSGALKSDFASSGSLEALAVALKRLTEEERAKLAAMLVGRVSDKAK